MNQLMGCKGLVRQHSGLFANSPHKPFYEDNYQMSNDY